MSVKTEKAPKIELTETTFTDRKVKVCSSSTVHAEAYAYDLITKEEFKARLAELAKACKEHRCRLYRKGFKELLELFEEYKAAHAHSHELFRQYSDCLLYTSDAADE